MRPLAAWVLGATLLGAGACEHASPGAVAPPADVGPFSPSLPRRLTFSAGDDRTPSVTGDVILYARQGTGYPNPPSAVLGREECIAFLPVEGGTLLRELCPHDLIVPADGFVQTWYEPSLSPDGTRLAFTWQRIPDGRPPSFSSAFLMVTAVDRPADTTATRVMISYAENGTQSRRANQASRITWLSAERLRFLATYEDIVVVRYGGANRSADTLYEPLALLEMDVASGATQVVPGGDAVIAYANAPDGKIWIVRAPDPAALLLLDPATGVRSSVGRFSSAVVDLIAVGGSLVAAVAPVYDPATGLPDGGGALEVLDPATGARTPLPAMPGPIHRLAAAGGRRFVVEAESSLRPFGIPADLWLLEVP